MIENKNRVNASSMMFFASIMAIACLISGVLLCSALVEYAENSSIPVATVNVVEPMNEVLVEEEEEIYTIVRERYQFNPSFKIVDSEKTWVAENEVNIFKVAYDNDLGEITVQGNGNKVIAPGTMNSYYFELVNDGDVGIDYQVVMEAYLSDNVTTIPVETKLSDYTGRYILGSETSWEDVLEVNRVNEEGELSAGNTMRYVFSWQWPFESGNDEFDTMLGNLATDEDITLTIKINALATADESAQGGFATGDDANVGVFFTSTIVSFGIMMLLIVLYRKGAKEDEA